MLLAPRPGMKYRDTETNLLVPDEGFEADLSNLDIARAIACGDLVEVQPADAAKTASATTKEAR